MNQSQRQAMQNMVRNAARKASRNPRPDQPDLACQLEQLGLAYLDAHQEQIEQQLDTGVSAYSVARSFYGLVIVHLLAFRKADNAAYWAAAKAAKAA